MVCGMKHFHEQAWLSLKVEEVLAALESDAAKGLPNQEASDRIQQLGPNELTQKKRQGPLIRFLLQFKQPLVIILLAGTVITFFLREYVDAFVILGSATCFSGPAWAPWRCSSCSSPMRRS